MSRTYRYIPHWAKLPSNFELTFNGLYGGRCDDDKRNRFINGYDKHKAMSPVYIAYFDREYVTGDNRKFFKRKFNRAKRRRKIDMEY